jgi:hypothetical protein
MLKGNQEQLVALGRLDFFFWISGWSFLDIQIEYPVALVDGWCWDGAQPACGARFAE